MSHPPRFEMRSVFMPALGHHRRFRVAKCSTCPKDGLVSDASTDGLPAEAIAHKFRQQGWHIASRSKG